MKAILKSGIIIAIISITLVGCGPRFWGHGGGGNNSGGGGNHSGGMSNHR